MVKGKKTYVVIFYTDCGTVISGCTSCENSGGDVSCDSCETGKKPNSAGSECFGKEFVKTSALCNTDELRANTNVIHT